MAGLQTIYVDESVPQGDPESQFYHRKVTFKRNKDVRQNFDILNEIGRGKFGKVMKCRKKDNGEQFAAKFVLCSTREDRRNVEREVEIMNMLKSSKLLQLFDAYENGRTEMCLITEYIGGGELFDRVIEDEFVLTERACVCFMKQILEGVSYIHHQEIIHLDLKPENILCLTRTGNRIKIIDFGLARKFEPLKKLQVLFGTPEFVAPEVVGFEPISYATDMWAVGVICYVLLSGLSPFMGDTDLETMANVTIAEYDYEDEAFDDISPEARDFMDRLLIKEKEKRSSADNCLKHNWIQQLEIQRSPIKNETLKSAKNNLATHKELWKELENHDYVFDDFNQTISIPTASPTKMMEAPNFAPLVTSPSIDIKAESVHPSNLDLLSPSLGRSPSPGIFTLEQVQKKAVEISERKNSARLDGVFVNPEMEAHPRLGSVCSTPTPSVSAEREIAPEPSEQLCLTQDSTMFILDTDQGPSTASSGFQDDMSCVSGGLEPLRSEPSNSFKDCDKATICMDIDGQPLWQATERTITPLFEVGTPHILGSGQVSKSNSELFIQNCDLPLPSTSTSVPQPTSKEQPDQSEANSVGHDETSDRSSWEQDSTPGDEVQNNRDRTNDTVNGANNMLDLDPVSEVLEERGSQGSAEPPFKIPKAPNAATEFRPINFKPCPPTRKSHPISVTNTPTSPKPYRRSAPSSETPRSERIDLCNGDSVENALSVSSDLFQDIENMVQSVSFHPDSEPTTSRSHSNLFQKTPKSAEQARTENIKSTLDALLEEVDKQIRFSFNQDNGVQSKNNKTLKEHRERLSDSISNVREDLVDVKNDINRLKSDLSDTKLNLETDSKPLMDLMNTLENIVPGSSPLSSDRSLRFSRTNSTQEFHDIETAMSQLERTILEFPGSTRNENGGKSNRKSSNKSVFSSAKTGSVHETKFKFERKTSEPPTTLNPGAKSRQRSITPFRSARSPSPHQIATIRRRSPSPVKTGVVNRARNRFEAPTASTIHRQLSDGHQTLPKTFKLGASSRVPVKEPMVYPRQRFPESSVPSAPSKSRSRANNRPESPPKPMRHSYSNMNATLPRSSSKSGVSSIPVPKNTSLIGIPSTRSNQYSKQSLVNSIRASPRRQSGPALDSGSFVPTRIPVTFTSNHIGPLKQSNNLSYGFSDL